MAWRFFAMGGLGDLCDATLRWCGVICVNPRDLWFHCAMESSPICVICGKSVMVRWS
jgi:hypothetical protein